MLVRGRIRPSRFPVVRLSLTLFGLSAAAAETTAGPAPPTDGVVAPLSSPDLPGVERMVEAAARQRAALAADLADALAERRRTWEILRRREQAPLRFAPGPWRRWARRDFAAAEAAAFDLQAAIALSRIEVAFDGQPASRAAERTLWEAFAALNEADRVWDAAGPRDPDGGRTAVAPACCHDEVLVGDRPPLCLQSAEGARLALYPGFAVVREGRAAPRRLFDPRDVAVEVATVDIPERRAVPADASVVGRTWVYANRDGSPDRRFKRNREIPLVRYAAIRISTPLGLFADLRVSDGAAAAAFGFAVLNLQTALAEMARNPPPDDPPPPVAPSPLDAPPPLPPLAPVEPAYGTAVAAAACGLVVLGLAAAVAALRHHTFPESSADPVRIASVDPIEPRPPPPPSRPSPPPPGPAPPLFAGSAPPPSIGSPPPTGGRPATGSRPGPRAGLGIGRRTLARPRALWPASPAALSAEVDSDLPMTTRRPTALRTRPTPAGLDVATVASGVRLDVFDRRGAWVEVGLWRPWGWVSAKALARPF